MTAPADRSYDHLLFTGTHGHVAALDKASGATVWEASLPKSGYQVVALVFEDDTLFCASGGRVYALDPANGHILWTNEMPGLHSGLVFLTTAQSSHPESLMAVLAAHQAQVRSRQSGSAGA